MAVPKKKNASKQRKVNPFELKFNKSKHNILGKKKMNQDGAPAVAKKRAYEQREKTLGVEYDRKNKISKIHDKRLGEKGDKTDAEKNAMRFAEERSKNFKRSSKFNLADDMEEEEEILTHKGKALSDIEKYDKSMISDSDDDDDPGNIGAKMVKVAHFGGGEKTTEEKVKERISRDDLISNLIAKSKLAKHEKQTEKDEMEIMTENLDSKYQSLMSKIQGSFKPTGWKVQEKDDYDKLALNLKIEADARATPAERKLTEGELAMREKEKLDSLEAARINAKYNASSHISADADVDVDAGSKADARKMKQKNARFEVRFADDGKIVDEDKIQKSSIQKRGGEESEEDEDMEDEFEDEEEDLDDLLEEDEDELESDEEEEEEEIVAPKKKKAKKTEEKVEEGVPFVFEMPKNYNKFCDLLRKYEKDMELVVERLVKCHHPSLKEGNKQKLNKLFLMCLRWFDDMTKEELETSTFQEINLAQNTIHSLLKFDIQYGVRCVRALIRQHWKARQDKEKSAACSFSIISVLRLVSGLFPVTDSWHPVVIPAFFLSTNVISSAKIDSLSTLAKQILLGTTILEYVSESKRYVPELISFIKSALLLAVKEKPETFSSKGFPITSPYSEMLCFTSKNTVKVEPIILGSIFNNTKAAVKDNDTLKLTVFRALISLVQHIRVIYSNQDECYNILFSPFLRILNQIDTTFIPKEGKEELETLIASMTAECNSKQRLTQLSLVKTEKSMLKMLEPRFEWDFDPERPHKGPKNDKKKMQKQYKNEMRGAIKELRKDTAFLARKQMTNVKAKDRARNVATKRLMGGLMQQQGEWNKEMRTKDVEVKKAKK